MLFFVTAGLVRYMIANGDNGKYIGLGLNGAERTTIMIDRRNRKFRKPFPALIFPSHLLKCGGTKKMRRDQQMSSNVHPNFQDKKIKDEVGLVSEVLKFTSADPRTLRTSENAAELVEVSQFSSTNFSYGNGKKREMSMSPAWSDSSHT